MEDQKRARFEKIAVKRTQTAVTAIAKLANCSNPATYDYDENDVERLFTALETQIARTRAEFARAINGRGDPIKVSLSDPTDD